MNNNEWFKLEDVKLIVGDDVNNFSRLKEKLEKADKITNSSWRLSYVKIEAKLTFMGTLQTPNGSTNTEFTYFIKTNYKDMKEEAKLTIYEQTFTGLDEAVTIRFSSGSIISKIVFGDIEKCYVKLKEEVEKQIVEYNEKVEAFNNEIQELIDKSSESEES